MVSQINLTRPSMRRAPMASEDFLNMPVLIDDRINGEHGRDSFGHAFARFAHGIAIQQPRAYAISPSAPFKIQRQHVRRLDRSGGRKAWADGFAAACEASEVVKADCAGDDDSREFCQCAIDLDRCSI